MLHRRLKIILLLLVSNCIAFSQSILEFPVEINSMIRNGTCLVTHSQLDIGSISDVFDGNDESLARSANINPLVITLAFPFAVDFSGSRILHSYGNGWWTLEGADTEEDLVNQAGTYVQLITMSSLLDAQPDEISFATQSKRIIRLTVMRTTGDDYVHLNDWRFTDATAQVEITSLCLRPSEVWLLPNTNFEVFLHGSDPNGLSYPITTDIVWNSGNENIVIVEPTGDHVNIVSNDDKGSTSILASWNGLQHSIPVKVVDDFTPKKAGTRNVKVALVIIDPPIAAEGGMRFHERFGWDDPVTLADKLADSLNAVSEGVVHYEITSTIDEQNLFAALQGTFVSVDSMYRLFLEPGWETFHQLEQTGGFFFDYNGLLDAHDFCSQSNKKEIDEVWVYSMPFTGMYESRLTGDGSFWYNSPPLDGNSCVDQLPIMGFNYERGLAEAMHSFGHRIESAMAHTFGRWDYDAIEKNDWEKFTSYDIVAPGESHVGNIHFPPNARQDYDYSFYAPVLSYEGNWSRYPFLFDEQHYVATKQWNYNELGYMSWWFRHLPHFACENRDGILNNWWSYIVDFNEGKELEDEVSDCQCEYVSGTTAIQVEENQIGIEIFPNPAIENTTVLFKNPIYHDLKLQVVSNIGEIVYDGVVEKGSYSFRVDLRQFMPGLYTLQVSDLNQGLLFSGQFLKIGSK